MEVSILKLLGLENSKTVIPSQVAAFNERGPSKWVVVSILKLLGLENSKAVTPSPVGCFFNGQFREYDNPRNQKTPGQSLQIRMVVESVAISAVI